MSTGQEPQQQPQAGDTAQAGEFQKLLKRPVKFGPDGVKIDDLDDLWRFASMVVQSGIAPKGMNTPQAVMIAVSMGAELGMKPMASLQNIAVINGRPSVWGDAMLALCRQSGIFDEAVFSETYDASLRGGTATCVVRRKPDGKTISHTFSLEDAKRAGLLGKNTPWQTYPERMLMFRARSWALRDAFGDVLGAMRAAEEERDIPTNGQAGAVPDATQRHIEQAKTKHEPTVESEPVEEAPPETPKPKPKAKKKAKPTPTEEPPVNPPTPEEVAEHEPSEVAGTLQEEFATDMGAAESAPVLQSIIKKYKGNLLLTSTQIAELDELAKGHKTRLSKD